MDELVTNLLETRKNVEEGDTRNQAHLLCRTLERFRMRRRRQSEGLRKDGVQERRISQKSVQGSVRLPVLFRSLNGQLAFFLPAGDWRLFSGETEPGRFTWVPGAAEGRGCKQGQLNERLLMVSYLAPRVLAANLICPQKETRSSLQREPHGPRMLAGTDPWDSLMKCPTLSLCGEADC